MGGLSVKRFINASLNIESQIDNPLISISLRQKTRAYCPRADGAAYYVSLVRPAEPNRRRLNLM